MWHEIQLAALRIRIQSRHFYEHAVGPFLNVLYWPALIASICSSLYWLRHIPTAGIAIGALGAAGVFVAIKGEKLPDGHRLLWACITLLFLVTEVRAIKKDRAEQDTQQAHTLLTIVEGYREEIEENQRHFDTTMSELDEDSSRLETLADYEARTLRNTQPYAAPEFQRVEIYPPDSAFQPGKRLSLNIYYTNAGNAVAQDIHYNAKAYVREQNASPEVGKEMVKDFEEWWKHSTHQGRGPARPHVQAFYSFNSEPFTEAELKGIKDHTLTMYVLMRFTWTDTTGRWIGDECFSYQDLTHDSIVTHYCLFHDNSRYKAKSSH